MFEPVPRLVHQRLVLMPHGPPVSEADGSRCMELVLWCGGDLGRVVDRPEGDVERFARYVSRIGGVRDGSEQALVMLTRTNPLALRVVETRRRLEMLVPALVQARWAIFVDTNDDPLFVSMATRLGHLTDEVDEAPQWIGPGELRFVVVTPQTRDRDKLEESLRAIDQAGLARSGVRRRR